MDALSLFVSAMGSAAWPRLIPTRAIVSPHPALLRIFSILSTPIISPMALLTS